MNIMKTRHHSHCVRFSEPSVIHSKSPLELLQTTKERNSLWYSTTEILTFRQETRHTCRLLRKRLRRLKLAKCEADPVRINESFRVELSQCWHDQPSLSLCPQTRGLEARYCLERQRRKYLASKFILTAASILHHTSEDADKLAEVAKRCNAWATILAIKEASRDYIIAYGDEGLLKFSARKQNFELQDSLVVRCNDEEIGMKMMQKIV